MSLKNWEFFQEKAKKAVAEMEQVKRENAALVANYDALARQVESMEEAIAAAKDENHKLRSRLKAAVRWLEQLDADHQRTIVEALSIIEKEIK